MISVVRPFQSDDYAAFLQFYRLCLNHYDIPHNNMAQEDRISSQMSSERHMSCHLAFDQNTPAGFATWNLSFPSGPGLALVMKELFVSPEFRGNRAGTALLAALIDVAKTNDCERIDWATDGNNRTAQSFDQQIGA
ncbi:GNAT family N-acetyltransferase [Gymnodinialimonas sp.]